jgi:hypothetical protein
MAGRQQALVMLFGAFESENLKNYNQITKNWVRRAKKGTEK